MNNKGQGTITERVGKKGCSFQAKVKIDGTFYTGTFPNRKEANAFIQDIQSKLRRGEAVNHNKVKKTHLSQIFGEYLESNSALPTSKKQRIQKLINEIGNVPLEKFTSNGFESYLKHKKTQNIPANRSKKKIEPLPDKKYSSGSIRKFYYDIRTALKWHSKKYDYVFNSKPFDDNPAPPAWEKPRERRLTDKEFEALLDACHKMYVNKDELKAIINFQRYSAMRIGETIKMKWSDLRLNEKEPSSSYIFVPKENQKTRNKVSCKDRYIPLRPELYHLIKDTIMKFKKSDGLVFPYWTNVHPLSAKFRLLCKNADISDFRIHDLRHEAISWLFENTPLTDIEISNISGHIEMDTLKRYANLRPSKTGAKLWGINNLIIS